MKRKIFIGTSGWMYKHWGDKFYPEDLKKDFLPFFADHFSTVEINSSFYRMPSKNAFGKWKKETPPGFIFSVKLNRYLTHRKRLILDEESGSFLDEFLLRQRELGKKLGVLLVQLPPSSSAIPERLDSFLKYVRKKYRKDLAVEFRHASWFVPITFKILKKYRAALVWAHSEVYPIQKVFTSDFAYLRFHGPGSLFASRYNEEELRLWKDEIDSFPGRICRVYAYFNNDYESYAVDNALYLKELMMKPEKRPNPVLYKKYNP